MPVEDITVPANVSTSNVKMNNVADINVSGSEVADINVFGSEVNDLNVSGCELFENEFENTPSKCKNLNVSPSVLRLMSKFQFIIQHLTFIIILTLVIWLMLGMLNVKKVTTKKYLPNLNYLKISFIIVTLSSY